LVALIVVIGSIGIALLYSAAQAATGTRGRGTLARFVIGLALMIVIALVDVRVWLRVAYPFYGAMLFLLVVVEVMGHIGMARSAGSISVLRGAAVGMMKIALVLAAGKYFHGLSHEDMDIRPSWLRRFLWCWPVGLVLLQPNLGTALLLVLASGAVFFCGGVRWGSF